MRILFVNVYAYVTGGADVHCLELCRGLRERDHAIAILATESDQNEEHEGAFVPLGVTHSTRDDVHLRQKPRIAMDAFWNRRAARATTRLLRDFDPQIVHIHKAYPQLSVAPVLCAHRKRVPIVQTLHDYQFISANPLDDCGHWLDRGETRLSYRVLNTATLPIRRFVHVPRVSSFIAVSRFVARIHASRGIHATVLPNFVAPAPAPRRASFEDREGIVYFGRLQAEKGVEHVLEVARRLPEVPVYVAGWGTLAGHVAAEADRCPNLHFLGRLSPDATRDLIGTARLAILPSLWSEPGALASLEAMAEGTPVIAYDVGGIAEYVADSGAGVVVAPDVDALANACVALHDDEPRWRELSLNAFRAIERTHSRERYLDRLERVYEEALNRAANPHRGR
jgi:glycosyltransferase involved in cell wall biosynthesis